jgi:hypothetical protein
MHNDLNDTILVSNQLRPTMLKINPTLPSLSVTSDHLMLQSDGAVFHQVIQPIPVCGQPQVFLPPTEDSTSLKITRSIDPLERNAELCTFAQTTLAASITAPSVGQPYIYLLPTLDRSYVKIGRSDVPLDRIATLTNVYPDIDLPRSVILGVDSHRIETILHLVFGLRRQPLESRCDGYTEWFIGDFLDEAIAFTQQVAHHRGVEYPVFRNVDQLLQEYRVQNPHAGERAPRLTRAERQSRAENVPHLLREAILDRTLEFINTLYEGDFDAIVHHGGQAYLTRTVYRQQEPECWEQQGAHASSHWGRRLAEQALVSVHVDGGSCAFHLLSFSTFLPLDDSHGHEYFRISQLRPEASGDRAGLPNLTDVAFDELWNAIEHLPLIDAGDAQDPTQRNDR